MATQMYGFRLRQIAYAFSSPLLFFSAPFAHFSAAMRAQAVKGAKRRSEPLTSEHVWHNGKANGKRSSSSSASARAALAAHHRARKRS